MTATLKSTRCGRRSQCRVTSLQGRRRHDRNDLGKTPDEPQRREQTEGAAVSMLEARPGQAAENILLLDDPDLSRLKTLVERSVRRRVRAI